jgi:hypothetical protein
MVEPLESHEETEMKLVQGKCDDPRKIEIARDLWLVPMDAKEQAIADARALCEERFDLPRDHPLYGKRALRVVPAGSGDIIATDKGIEPAATAASAAPPDEEGGT